MKFNKLKVLKYMVWRLCREL